MQRLAGDNPTYPGITPNTRSNTEPGIGTPIHPSSLPKNRQGPGTGAEEPHFDYPAGDDNIFDYDHESEVATQDIQSFADGKEKLLFNSDRLVSEAVDMVLDVNSKILSAAFPEQVVLNRMWIEHVEEGHLITGDLEFNFHLVSPGFGRRGQARIIISIRQGVLIPPKHIMDHMGRKFAITDKGIKDLLHIDDSMINIRFWKGPSQRSYVDER